MNTKEKQNKLVKIENNNIYNMDCVKGMNLISNNSIDLIITDPPYGVDFSKGFDDSKENVESNIGIWLEEMYRVLKEGSHCYIFIPSKEAGLWITKAQENFTLMNILSTKTHLTSTYLKNNFKFDNQLVLYLSKGKAKTFNKVDFIKTSDCWLKDKRNKNPKEYTYSYPSFLDIFSNEKSTSKSKKENRHPCAKSISFIEILIKLSSNENEVVLDPFAGGGSTSLAALNTNRHFITFELSKDYYKTTKEKINNKIKELDKIYFNIAKKDLIEQLNIFFSYNVSLKT